MVEMGFDLRLVYSTLQLGTEVISVWLVGQLGESLSPTSCQVSLSQYFPG